MVLSRRDRAARRAPDVEVGAILLGGSADVEWTGARFVVAWPSMGSAASARVLVRSVRCASVTTLRPSMDRNKGPP